MQSKLFTHKLFKRIFILLVGICVVGLSGHSVYAQSADPDALRGGIDRLSKEIEELEKEIATYRVEAEFKPAST